MSQDPPEGRQVFSEVTPSLTVTDGDHPSELGSYEVVSARAAYNDRNGNSPEMEIHFAEGRGDQTPKPQMIREPDIPEEACATIDTGCQRMAIGYDTLQKLANYLPDELSVGLIPQEHRFRSVHGRSATTHVASLPTSIGPKGSLLRPAVFENEESRRAPFLISLPFLLFCRTVLYLDPDRGLKAYFRKLDFTVPCHLGPSGALRIPLCEFTSETKQKLQEAQQEFCERTGEFEVLRISASHGDRNPLTPDSSDRHGAAVIQEEPFAADPEPIKAGVLASSGAQDHVPTPQDERPDCQPAEEPLLHGRERLRAGFSMLSPIREDPGNMAISATNLTSTEQPCPKCPEQFIGEVTDSQATGIIPGSQPSWRTLPGIPTSSTSTSRSTGPSNEDGDQQSTDLPMPVDMFATSMSEGRKQLPSTLLEVPEGSGRPVRILPVVPEPTNLVGQHPGRPPTGEDLRQTPSRDCPERPAAVHSPEDIASRNQCLQEDHSLCDMRQGAERGVHGTIQADQEPPDEEQLREACRIVNSPDRKKKLQRTVKQAVSALKSAEAMWQELLSLIGSQENSQPENAIDVLRAKCLPDQQSTDRRCKKSLKQAANLLGRPDMKSHVVAEIFNPKRFGNQAKSTGLREGEAFDILLGHNLLDAKERNRVRQYVKTNKPGLTCVAPPCTLFSMLQNLNLRHLDTREKLLEHARKLTEARVLLDFGIEICSMVADYGGSFLFEHPLTSKAWKEPKVQRLMSDLRNKLAKNDQCVFNLRSATGELHKKPTGWLTNNDEIYKALNVRCPGNHDHVPILGGGPGGSRSKQAQHYTPELVRTVLSAYRRSLQEKQEIYLTKSEQYLEECDYADRVVYYTDVIDENGVITNAQVPEENAVVKDVNVLQNDVVTSNVDALTNHEDPDPVECYANEEDDKAEEATEDHPEAEPEPGAPYRLLPRERPFSVEQLVRRAHNGLGHPAPDKLVRILKEAKASPEAIQAARALKCEICAKHQATRPCRAAAPPRELTFNQVIGVDTVWLPGPVPGGKHRMALNVIDWCSRFQLMIPLRDHTPLGAKRALLQWIRLFGPPERVYDDLGKEFRGAFADFMDEQSIFLDPSSLETPEQRGITERAGKIFKEVLAKTLYEVSCEDWDTWEETVMIVNATLNRLTNRSGFSPCQRVFWL